MTVYVAPCGVSVFDGVDRRRHGTHGAARDLAAAAQRWGAAAVHADSDDHAFVQWRHTWAKDDLGEDSGVGRWSPAVCAETSTLSHRAADIDRLLTDGHTVVLLASDTARGVGAAMLAASRIALGDIDAVRYVSAPGFDRGQRSAASTSWDAGLRSGTVTVVRVRRLDPTVRHGFRTATAGIGQALRAALDRAGGSEAVEVHLTAGYKATLLHTLAMTEVLASGAPGRVSAWYLYDDLPDRAEAVPIGLRRFRAHQIALMRDELIAVRDGHAPDTDVFHEVAWETATDGHRELTDFGTGYLAVLGEPVVPPADAAGVERR